MIGYDVLCSNLYELPPHVFEISGQKIEHKRWKYNFVNFYTPLYKPQRIVDM